MGGVSDCHSNRDPGSGPRSSIDRHHGRPWRRLRRHRHQPALRAKGGRQGDGLRLACEQGKLSGLDLSDITYYIGRETIIPSEEVAGMWVWRETLFAFLQRNAERSAAFFGVPTKQVVEFGTEIEI